MDVTVAVNQELIREIQRLRARVETMEHALRVIDTWVAAERLMTDKQRTVVPKHVARIIAQVLGYGEKAR